MNRKSVIKGYGDSREVFIDDVPLNPLKSQSAFNHSPDGFNWGYGGSGPSQLALALLLEITNKETALRHYQSFKWDVVAGLPKDFEISGEKIFNWLDVKIQENKN